MNHEVSKEAELICFEKEHVSPTPKSENREGKASIHENPLTRGEKTALKLYFLRGE